MNQKTLYAVFSDTEDQMAAFSYLKEKVAGDEMTFSPMGLFSIRRHGADQMMLRFLLEGWSFVYTDQPVDFVRKMVLSGFLKRYTRLRLDPETLKKIQGQAKESRSGDGKTQGQAKGSRSGDGKTQGQAKGSRSGDEIKQCQAKWSRLENEIIHDQTKKVHSGNSKRHDFEDPAELNAREGINGEDEAEGLAELKALASNLLQRVDEKEERRILQLCGMEKDADGVLQRAGKVQIPEEEQRFLARHGIGLAERNAKEAPPFVLTMSYALKVRDGVSISRNWPGLHHDILIFDGPLAGQDVKLVRVDRHKKIGIVQIPFLGKPVDVKVPLEIAKVVE